MLERLKQQVSPYRNARRWLVAYSGGLDSHSLLHALSLLKTSDSSLPELIAVHVNHQLQADAAHWENHCQQQAELLSVEYQSYKVTITGNGNIEAQAREARYQIFSGLVQEGDCIFLAHHQQDQIETFFYRLFRGAGIKGLASIAKERSLGKGILARPMLEISRDQILAHAQQYQLQFIDDPSNDDTSFDRNYIRHQLLPVIQQRWPAYMLSIQRAIKHSQESVGLLDDLAQADLSVIETSSVEVVEPWLALQAINRLSLGRQKNLLRYWLEQYNLQLTEKQLVELIENVIGASEDANPQLQIADKVLRRFQSRLYMTDTDSVPGFETFEWSAQEPCHVPGYGTLSLTKPLDIMLTVSARKGGEMIRPAGSKQTRKLKTLLQEMNIPPWQRQRLPLIYCGGELIAVADLVCSESAAGVLADCQIIRS